MSKTIQKLTLYVNRQAKTIPPQMWQPVKAKPVDFALQIMQAFSIVTEEAAGVEQRGAAGDYIVELASGRHVVVPADLFAALFSELGGGV